MLLPHRGAVPGSATWLADVLERLRLGVGDAHVGGADRREQPRLGVHLADEVVHTRERVGVLMDDDVDAVVERRELGVGDDARDLDDRVALDVEAGHLEVEPHQMVVVRASGHERHAIRPRTCNGAGVRFGGR